MAVLFAAGATWAGQRTGSRRLAIFATLWSADVGVVLMCLYGFTGNLALMPIVEQVLHASYVQSGLNAPRDFVVHNMLEATSLRLIVVPIFALLAGAVGAWIAAFTPGFGYAVARRRS